MHASLATWVLELLLAMLFLIDAYCLLLPNFLSYAVISLGLVNTVTHLWCSWVNSLVGGILAFTLFYLTAWYGKWYFKKESMGQGDIKLAIGIGLCFGPNALCWIIVSACILALPYIFWLVLCRKMRWDTPLPLGSFLILATYFWLYLK